MLEKAQSYLGQGWIGTNGSDKGQCLGFISKLQQEVYGILYPIRGAQGAKDMLTATNTRPDLFEQVRNNPNDPNQMPSVGDVVVWGSSWGGGWGHIGVIESVNQSGFTSIEQNFVPNKVTRQAHDWNGVIGWIHNIPQTPPAQVIGATQRKVVGAGVKYRKEPNSNSELLITDVITDGIVDGGQIANLQGYVWGELVDGCSVWFKGTGGGYMWAGAFEDAGTHDLPNLTPPPPVTPDTSKYVIDVSKANSITDYATVISNVRGAIAKAGHTGKSYGGTPLNGDPKFVDFKKNFGDKLVGSYWYAYCSLNPVTEATNFVEAVGQVPENFTYWLDIEETDDQTNRQINTWCTVFLLEVEKLTKKVCGIYMNRNWFDNYITADVKANRPIWLAHYDTAEFSNPVANQVAHQFTSTGKVVGYGGNLDLNAVKDSFFTPTKISPPIAPESPTESPQPPITPPEPEKPPTPPENSSGTLLDAIKQFISKLIDWIASLKRG